MIVPRLQQVVELGIIFPNKSTADPKVEQLLMLPIHNYIPPIFWKFLKYRVTHAVWLIEYDSYDMSHIWGEFYLQHFSLQMPILLHSASVFELQIHRLVFQHSNQISEVHPKMPYYESYSWLVTDELEKWVRPFYILDEFSNCHVMILRVNYLRRRILLRILKIFELEFLNLQ